MRITTSCAYLGNAIPLIRQTQSFTIALQVIFFLYIECLGMSEMEAYNGTRVKFEYSEARQRLQ